MVERFRGGVPGRVHGARDCSTAQTFNKVGLGHRFDLGWALFFLHLTRTHSRDARLGRFCGSLLATLWVLSVRRLSYTRSRSPSTSYDKVSSATCACACGRSINSGCGGTRLGRGVGGAIPRERVLRAFDVKKLPNDYRRELRPGDSLGAERDSPLADARVAAVEGPLA